MWYARLYEFDEGATDRGHNPPAWEGENVHFPTVKAELVKVVTSGTDFLGDTLTKTLEMDNLVEYMVVSESGMPVAHAVIEYDEVVGA